MLHKTDQLPLTCSRKGTCCFGKDVYINPWELNQLAKAKGVETPEFISQHCESTGIQLKFNGTKDKKGQSACSLYVTNFGCSNHKGRPLACRLYPLGRQIQNHNSQYIFEGKTFPCLTDCKEVLNLPQLTVDEYLAGQEVDLFEKAQDEYLEVVQNLADIALTLVLETEMDTDLIDNTLTSWEKIGSEDVQYIKNRISTKWLELLLTPSIKESDNPTIFIQIHNELLQNKAQDEFEKLTSFIEISNFAIELMLCTSLLAKSIGADVNSLIQMWINVVKENQ